MSVDDKTQPTDAPRGRPPQSQPITIVVGVSLLIGLGVHLREVTKLWHAPKAVPTQEIPFAQLKEDPSLFYVEGFVRGEDGFYLEPKTVGLFQFRLEVAPPRHVAVEPVFYNIVETKRYRNRFQYSLNGGVDWVPAWENRSYLRSRSVVIPPTSVTFVVLRFDAANTTDERALVLQGVRVRAGVEPNVLPRLAGILYGLSLALLAFLVFTEAGITGRRAQWAGIAAGAVGTLMPSAPLAFAAIFVGGAVWLRIKKLEFRWKMLEVPALLLILAIGLQFREAKLREYEHSPIVDDAAGYHEFAHKMKPFTWQEGFYAPRYREPMFPLALKLFFAVFADSDLHHRLVSVYFGVIAIALVWWLGREAFHPFCGLAAALVMATDRYLIFRSMYGYRLELRTALMVLFIYGLFVCRRGRPGWRFALAGIAGALLALTELSTFPAVTFFLAWHVVANRKEWKPAITAVVAAVIVLAPFFIRQTAEHGDPFRPLSKHATWYRNVEAQMNVGEPGYPTEEEIHKYVGYEGPPITLFEYLFGTHTLGQLATGATKGYARYLSGEPFFRTWLLRLLFVVGLALVLIRPGHRALGFTILVTNTPPAMYLYGLDILHEERVLLHVLPFAAICAAVPLIRALDALLERQRAPAPGDSPSAPS